MLDAVICDLADASITPQVGTAMARNLNIKFAFAKARVQLGNTAGQPHRELIGYRKKTA